MAVTAEKHPAAEPQADAVSEILAALQRIQAELADVAVRLEALKTADGEREPKPKLKKGSLADLRGIAKVEGIPDDYDVTADIKAQYEAHIQSIIAAAEQ